MSPDQPRIVGLLLQLLQYHSLPTTLSHCYFVPRSGPFVPEDMVLIALNPHGPASGLSDSLQRVPETCPHTYLLPVVHYS
jgi:hypothetical protein